MRKISLLLLLALLMTACTGTPTPVVVVPTLAVLPSATPSPTWTPSPLPTLTPLPSDTTTATQTSSPTDTETPSPTSTPIPSLTDTPTDTQTSTLTDTLTPSQTITNTITPTPSSTFTASPELDGLGMLALLSQRATILPPEQLYNPQTLTAVAIAGQTLVAVGTNVAPTAEISTPVIGEPQLATLPPPMSGGNTNPNPVTTTCANPLPAGLSASFQADPSITQAIGCPQGQPLSTTTAVQGFEHGTMIYLQGSPGSIYVLTLDGRFRRFDDTWVSGVDPETGGETPPLGMIEPKRGFGKVWRSNLDVRGSLGWGVTDEEGAASSLLLFDRGRAVFLPTRSQTYLLIDDPGGASGSWRIVPGSF